MKRKILTFLTVIFAFVTALAFTAACTPENIEKGGEEVGEYYCAAGNEEYTLKLTEELKYELVAGEQSSTGEYSIDGEALTLKNGEETISATFSGDEIALTLGGSNYTFLRKTMYTVTFMADGVSVATVKVMNGKAVEKPEAPEKTDYAFVGWYVDAEGKEAYVFDTPIRKDTTLYARFVEKIDPEFKVSFDLGYEGAEGYEPVLTTGGRVFGLPKPERADAKFAGWWVSTDNTRAKLSYRYEDQATSDKVQTLAEHTTLFAVWEGDAPIVSVGEKSIEWTSLGANTRYTVRIETGNGALVETQEVNTTSFAFDFSERAEGEYVVTVAANGQTGTAYYNNKALARVCVFEVDEATSTLVFNTVANAEEYFITVECGTEDHDHTDVSLGTNSAFDFSLCDMKAGGIVFTVTAKANGYTSSVSKPFSYERTLDEIDDLTVNEADESVTWSAVPNAASYNVEVTIDGETAFNDNIGSATNFSLKSFKSGAIVVKVTPVARGWNSPAAAEANYTKDRLATPSDVRLVGTNVVWTAVDGADSYIIRIGNSEHTVTTNSFPLDESYFAGGAINITVSVQAVSATTSKSSLFSDEIVIRNEDMGDTVTYSGGYASWDGVFGVTEYAVKVNDGEPVRVSETTVKITLTKEGENTISVAVVSQDGTIGTWVEIKVTAYKIELDAQEGTVNGPVYRADGDPLDLPYASRYGYTFGGWYTANGVAYNDRYFTDAKNVSLRAKWEPNTYMVEFDSGSYGKPVEDSPVRYHESYTLPVPEATDVTKAFVGWFTEPNGSGLQYTDNLGNSRNDYPATNGVKLYAQWVDLYIFTQVTTTSGAGYEISANPNGISYVTEITIPAYYNQIPVVTVHDFSKCTKLQVVNIPDTVKAVDLGSTAIVFDGCSALREVNVYAPEGVEKHEVFYESYEGGLIYNNPSASEKQFVYYPRGRAGLYIIPDGVQSITAGAFRYASTLSEIRIPASVTKVETEAFYSCGQLSTITFLEGEAGTVDQPLTVYSKAFSSCSSIAEITLPARITEFSLEAFSNSSKINNIYVVGEGGTYSSVDGLLCKQATVDKVEVTELVLVPTAREGRFEVPDEIASIGDNAFNKNTKITDVVIHGGVRRIGREAFLSCSGILTLTFEGTSTDVPLTIEWKAFYSCSKLEEITLPGNLVKMEEGAFGSTTHLFTVHVDSGMPGAELDFAEHSFGTIPTGTSTLRTYYVTTLFLGANVPTLDIPGVFGYKVASVTVAQGNPNYEAEDNILYTKGKTSIAYYPSDKAGAYVVPNTVTSISASTFRDRDALTAITIPGSVASIGDHAFNGCDALVTVTFDDSQGTLASALTIGVSVFQNCKLIQTISLPDRTTTIGDAAFSGCTALTSIHLGSKVMKIGTATEDKFDVFQNCNNLSTIEVDPANTMYASTNEGILCGKTPDEATGTDVISEIIYCPVGITGSVTIPATVRRIGAYAFRNCKSLEEVKWDVDEVDELTIGNYAFYMNSALRSINLPKGLSSIGNWAFYDCAITSLDLPEGLTTIGQYAIYSCKQITSITVPNTVTSIAKYAFYSLPLLETLTFTEGGEEELRFEDGSVDSNMEGTYYYGCIESCPNLRVLKLPERTSYIGKASLSELSLDELYLPSTVTELGTYAFVRTSASTFTFGADEEGRTELTAVPDYAFYYFTSGNDVEVPEGISSIGKSGFAYLKAPSISLPGSLGTVDNDGLYHMQVSDFSWQEGVTSLGDYALEYFGAESLTVPASVTTMGKGVFSYSSGLRTVTFAAGSKLEALPDNAFTRDNNLESVTFAGETKLASIGTSAFAQCSSLESFEVPASVKSIGDNAFNATPSLETFTFVEEDNLLESLGKNVFQSSGITAIRFPESSAATITLGEGLFKGCSALLSVHLSKPVASIANVFLGCGSIQSITVAEGHPNFSTKDGEKILYSADGKNIRYVYAPQNGEYHIADGAIEVGAGAFASQVDLVKVYIPETVQVIQPNAFDACINLQEVVFEGHSQLTTVSNYAFRNCWNLKSINFDITTNLDTIGDYAFQSCSSLTSVDLSKTKVKTIGSHGFDLCASLSDIKFSPVNVSLGSYSFAGTGFVNITLPATVTSVGTYCFQNCAALETVTMTDLTVKTIGTYCFYQCPSLQTVYLPWTLTGIPGHCFRGSGLVTITIPATVTEIATYAFEGCGNLEDVLFMNPAALSKALGAYAFRDCTALTQNFDFSGSKIPSVGSSAFQGSAITGIRLPSTVTFIGTSAFADCTGLTAIDFGNLTNWDGRYSSSKPTTSMDAKTFKGCTSLVSVIYPVSITHFGKEAFANCESLSSFNFADLVNVTTFISCSGTSTLGVFENTGFTSLDLDEVPSVSTTYGNGIFRNCKKLTEVTIGKDRKQIFQYMFAGCPNLTTVNIEYTGAKLTTSTTGTSVTSYVFQNCTALDTVNFGENCKLTDLGAHFFEGCTSLTEITLPKTMATPGSNAFANTGIKEIDLTNTAIKTLSTYLFQNCGSLESFTLPADITQIPTNFFDGCTALTGVIDLTGYSKLTTIGSHAFSGCTSVTEVKLPSTVTTLNTYSFAGSGLTTFTVPAGVAKLPNYLFQNCADLVTVDLGEATEIGQYTFMGCTNLTEVNVGNVTTWGTGAFRGATKVSFTTDEGSALVLDDAGAVYDGTGKLLYVPASAVQNGTFTVADFANTIGEYAFTGCTADEVIIPENVTTFANYAFAESNIKRITVPATVTAIGNYTFQNSAFEEVDIKTLAVDYRYTMSSSGSPTNVSGANLFDGCANLRSVTLPEGIEALGPYIFQDCVSLASIQLPQSLVSLGAIPTSANISSYAFSGCTALTSIELPENLYAIGASAFAESGLLDVVIPESVVYVGNSAFRFSALKSVTINGYYMAYQTTYATYTTYMFADTADLRTVNFGKAEGVGNYAFSNSGIEEVVIPETCLYFGTYAFQNCVNLRSVVFPEGYDGKYLSSSGESDTSNLFLGCTNLSSVTLPSTFTKFSSKMFADCTSLNLYVPIGVVGFVNATVSDSNNPFLNWTEGQKLSFEGSRYMVLSMFGVDWMKQFNGQVEFGVPRPTNG